MVGEARALVSLALPLAIGQAAILFLGVVDVAMLGRVSAAAQAAAALANAWLFGTLLVGSGMLAALQPVISRAHGADDGDECGLLLQRGLVLAGALSILLMTCWALTEPLLLALEQDPGLAAEAGTYARVQLPSVPFVMVALALSQYLNARERVGPAMWTALGANLVNLAANWILIFGHLGSPALGLRGAGIATTLGRIAGVAMLFALISRRRLLDGAWLPWSRRALEPNGLWALVVLGFPIVVHAGAALWATHATTLIVGRIDSASVAGHGIALNITYILSLLATGVAGAVAIRAGVHDGAGRQAELAGSIRTGAALAVGATALIAVPTLVLGRTTTSLFSADPIVVARAASVFPWAALYLAAGAVHSVLIGAARGLRRPVVGAWAALAGYWLVGLPLAYQAVLGGGDLAGVWRTMVIGVLVAMLVPAGWLYRRTAAANSADNGARGRAGP